jgi:hypothetical protein
VRKTEPDQAAALDLHAMAAERFPLLPLPKPVCRALETRIALVRECADMASQGTEDPLVRAAEAQNLAALIASDCGLPELARDLCWQQFEVFLTVRPLNTATAKLALQPLINLARLLIRAGDGTRNVPSTDRDGTGVRARDLIRSRMRGPARTSLDSLISSTQAAARALSASIPQPTHHR